MLSNGKEIAVVWANSTMDQCSERKRAHDLAGPIVFSSTDVTERNDSFWIKQPKEASGAIS